MGRYCFNILANVHKIPDIKMKYLPFFLLLPIMTLATPTTTAAKGRFFEMRTYTTHDGKLDALHKRFRDHTNTLFQKHGMELVGYWTPNQGEESSNTLVYILAFPSQEARNESWDAFRNDPEWQKAYEKSHEDAGGKIVKKVDSVFLSPTDYSPIK